MDIAATTQALASIPDERAFAATIGAALGVPLQAMLEHAVMEKPWLNAVAKSSKPFIPALVSAGVGAAALHFGVSPMVALSFSTALLVSAHVTNETPLASEAVEAKP